MKKGKGQQADKPTGGPLFLSSSPKKSEKGRRKGKEGGKKRKSTALYAQFIRLPTTRNKSPPQASPPQATIIFCRVGYLPTAVGGGLFFGWGTYLPSGGAPGR